MVPPTFSANKDWSRWPTPINAKAQHPTGFDRAVRSLATTRWQTSGDFRLSNPGADRTRM